MEPRSVLTTIVWGAVVLLAVVAWWNVRRRPGRATVRRGPGAGAAGAVYDMLNEDKRRAIEIIVEQKAEATDPETADDQPQSGSARRS